MRQHQPDPAPGADPERGFIVAVLGSDVDPDEELGEFRELSRTAGVDPVAEIVQRRPRPDERTYVGKGKLVELQRAFGDSQAESLLSTTSSTRRSSGFLEQRARRAGASNPRSPVLTISAEARGEREGSLRSSWRSFRGLPRMRGMWKHPRAARGGRGRATRNASSKILMVRAAPAFRCLEEPPEGDRRKQRATRRKERIETIRDDRGSRRPPDVRQVHAAETRRPAPRLRLRQRPPPRDGLSVPRAASTYEAGW